MFPEVTPAVSRALVSAPCWAAALGASVIDPVHLLLALLEEEEGRAATLFEEAALTRAAALHHLGRATKLDENAGADLPLSALSQKVFREARALAARLETDPTVTSEALLLAALHHDDDLRTTLEQLGLRFTQLEAAVATLHGSLILPVSQVTPVTMEETLLLDEPVESMDAARLLDAAANRAREALRVVEDYCRFTRNDAILTEQLKQIRHDLADVLQDLVPREHGLAARNTGGDVGTAISTPQEQTRHALLGVVEANLKRLQEALRSLEEFAKLSSSSLARRLEQLRYRSYTLEKAVLQGADARQRFSDVRLYVLVSSAACAAALDWTIAEAAAGGAQVFQLREKQMDDRSLLDRARRMRRWTRIAGVTFIVNDRPDIARLVDADGVHLGQTDMSVHDARRVLGSDAIIGASTHSIEQLRQAVSDGATYAAIGPTFPSQTKQFDSLAGLDFISQATSLTDIPLFAIGGITDDTAAQVLAAGARRIAVGHAICQAEDPRESTARLRRQIDALW